MIVAVALVGIIFLPSSPIRASNLPPAQQQLQHIIHLRHQAWLKLQAERTHEAWLQSKLSQSEYKLTLQQQRLLREQQQAAAQRAQFISAIEADQVKITNVGLAIVDARHEYRQVHHQAAGLLLRLKELKAEIHRQQGNIRTAVVQIYEMSQVNPLATVLEAKSLTDLMQQQSYVTRIGSSDYATLKLASQEHIAVYHVAKAYIDKMAALRRLQRQEILQLGVIRAATRHEDHLLAAAEKLASKRQHGIQQEEAVVQALTKSEQSRLLDVTASARSDTTMIAKDEVAAEQAALTVEQETGAVPPGVWSGTTPLAAQAVKTAEAFLGQVKSPVTPTGYWSGYCEGFAQFIYGEAFQAPSAIAEYHVMQAGGYVHPGIPLPGALVFYGGGEGYGHVAISIGDGQVISTLGYSGDKLPIAQNPYKYFPAYLGWAMPF